MSWRGIASDLVVIKQALVDANFEGEAARAVLMLLEIPSWWFEPGFWDGEKLPKKQREHLVRLLIDGFWGGDLDFKTTAEAEACFALIRDDPQLHPAYSRWRAYQAQENQTMAEVL